MIDPLTQNITLSVTMEKTQLMSHSVYIGEENGTRNLVWTLTGPTNGQCSYIVYRKVSGKYFEKA